jgi:hypothetical protein
LSIRNSKTHAKEAAKCSPIAEANFEKKIIELKKNTYGCTFQINWIMQQLLSQKLTPVNSRTARPIAF